MSSKKNDIQFTKDCAKWQVHSLEEIKAYLIKARKEAKRSAKKKWTNELLKVNNALRTAKHTRRTVSQFNLRV